MPGTSSATAAVEQAVTVGVLGVGAALAAWYVATTLAVLACTAASGLGRRWHAGEAAVRAWGAPVLRHSVTTAAGLALGAGLGVAGAADTASPTLPDDLGWRPTTAQGEHSEVDAAEAPPVAEAATATPTTMAPGSSHGRTARVVQPGDSLWAIAAEDLDARGLPTDAAAVARTWPRWYEANRAVVGPDPGLIHPGQELAPPREGVHR